MRVVGLLLEVTRFNPVLLKIGNNVTGTVVSNGGHT